MATFLLFIPLTLLVLIFLQRNNSWRGAVLSAAIVLGFLLTAITEFLSLFNWLTFRGLFALWLTVSLILTFFYFKDVNKIKTDNISKATKLTPFSIFLLCSVVFIVAMLAIIALISPPNNSDSMVYHMSRVVHWIQDKNVAFYPTRILRQLHSNPWAEFAILHFQILSGGDRFANLVQWLSMIGSIIGVSLIAEQLGANQRGQVFAATFAATIPMGILQASTTQNDYVVAFWMVCFVYHLLLLRTKEMDGAIWLYSLRAGVSLGLAILTKATAYIYAFPFLFLYVVCQFKASRPKLLRPLIIILGFSFVINLGHYVRNFDLYGKPLGPGQEAPTGYKYSNDIFTMTSFVSNILRNIGLQIATPFAAVNEIEERGIGFVHRRLGIDINDPRTTYTGTYFRIPKLSPSEDEAGNPVHFILIVATVSFFLLSLILGDKSSLILLNYSVSVTGAFLLFCLYLRWQPWHSRLHLPFFVLWSPFIGVVLSNIPKHKIINSVFVFIIFASLSDVFFSNARPLLRGKNIFNTTRIDQYFKTRPEIKETYMRMSKAVNDSGCSNVGLSLGVDDWEYPFWVLLQRHNRNFRIEHVNVDNVSQKKAATPAFETFSPCYIISP